MLTHLFDCVFLRFPLFVFDCYKSPELYTYSKIIIIFTMSASASGGMRDGRPDEQEQGQDASNDSINLNNNMEGVAGAGT